MSSSSRKPVGASPPKGREEVYERLGVIGITVGLAAILLAALPYVAAFLIGFVACYLPICALSTLIEAWDRRGRSAGQPAERAPL